ncbi:helix-turn-helix transcriptional regulator [Clostridium intestinale]|uniref:helix-turn-helix domain-containing protein n=1 Tax=Clostridium intestinale TaxID=36845 RepID=UPI0028E69A9E|nr:helix-turn-helix transcriptional regulator [Clostridium intestinale]
MDYTALGRRIREERLKLNLTQEQLAEQVDISTSYMGQIERGERNIALDTLVRMSNNLGVTVDYLLKDSVNTETNIFINQINQILSNRSSKDKQMALDVLKVMFAHLDDD